MSCSRLANGAFGGQDGDKGYCCQECGADVMFEHHLPTCSHHVNIQLEVPMKAEWMTSDGAKVWRNPFNATIQMGVVFTVDPRDVAAIGSMRMSDFPAYVTGKMVEALQTLLKKELTRQ